MVKVILGSFGVFLIFKNLVLEWKMHLDICVIQFMWSLSSILSSRAPNPWASCSLNYLSKITRKSISVRPKTETKSWVWLIFCRNIYIDSPQEQLNGSGAVIIRWVIWVKLLKNAFHRVKRSEENVLLNLCFAEIYVLTVKQWFRCGHELFE